MEANIRSLEVQFSEATAKKESLSQQVADCTVKLSRAEKLIGGLGGERSRWQATVEQLAQASHISAGVHTGKYTVLTQASKQLMPGCLHALPFHGG